jgi:hypothetical protein
MFFYAFFFAPFQDDVASPKSSDFSNLLANNGLRKIGESNLMVAVPAGIETCNMLLQHACRIKKRACSRTSLLIIHQIKRNLLIQILLMVVTHWCERYNLSMLCMPISTRTMLTL